MHKINLYCLPFAGASKYSYHSYAKVVADFINIIPVELPGRGSRFKEELLTDMNAMVDDVYEQIKKDLAVPYAIYGHSMGTVIGLLLTKRILAEKQIAPVHLFFTGCAGPSEKTDDKIRHLLSKNEFIQELKKLGGSPDEILNDDELLDFFEPILRADFKAIETYSHDTSLPFGMPITCLIGSDDKITEAQARAWKVETTGPFELLIFPGNHFFIFEHHCEIMQIISEKLYSHCFEDNFKATR